MWLTLLMLSTCTAGAGAARDNDTTSNHNDCELDHNTNPLTPEAHADRASGENVPRVPDSEAPHVLTLSSAEERSM